MHMSCQKNKAKNNLGVKLLIFSYQSVYTFVLGSQKNCLIDTVLLSTHNICFGWETRKLIFDYTLFYLEAWKILTFLVKLANSYNPKPGIS